MVENKDTTSMVQFYIDYMHGKEDYEYKYIRIVSVPTHYWEDKKYYRVSNIEIADIGENKHDFKEISFTVIRGKRAYRLTKIGRIVEKMTKGVAYRC